MTDVPKKGPVSPITDVRNPISVVRYQESGFRSPQRGSMYLFLIAGMLPCIFVAFMLLMDLGGLFTKFEQQQELADSAVLLGTRFLPHTQSATGAVQRYLIGQGVAPSDFTINASAVQVNVQLRKNIPITFAEFFGAAAAFPLSVVASARSNFRDVVLVMDSSSYLAPDVLTSAGAPNTASWPGYPAGQVYTPAGSSVGMPAAGFAFSGQPLDPTVLSQQCLNSDFVALKLAAIAAYDHFSARSDDALSVLFAPSAGGTVFTARDMRRSADGVAQGIAAEATIEGFHSPFFGYGDLYCALMADQECALRGVSPSFCRSDPGAALFLVPASPPDLPQPMIQAAAPNGSCSMTGNPSDCLVRRVPARPQELEFDPGFRTGRLTARQAIWTRSVQRAVQPLPNVTEPKRYADIMDIVRQVEFALLSAPYIPQRGGLSPDDVVLKHAIVLLGDVPGDRNGDVYPSSGMGAALIAELQQFAAEAQRRSLSVQLTFVVFDRGARSRAAAGIFSSAMTQFKSDAETAFNSADGRRNVTVIVESAAAQLSTAVIRSALLQGRTSVVAF